MAESQEKRIHSKRGYYAREFFVAFLGGLAPIFSGGNVSCQVRSGSGRGSRQEDPLRMLQFPLHLFRTPVFWAFGFLSRLATLHSVGQSATAAGQQRKDNRIPSICISHRPPTPHRVVCISSSASSPLTSEKVTPPFTHETHTVCALL